MSDAKMSASDFVRSRPFDMPEPQVVEEGAAIGLKFSRSLVSVVRSNARKRQGKKPKPRVRADGSLRDFIRRQPREMSAKEVVAAGKKAGLTFGPHHVWSTRHDDKKKQRATKAPRMAAHVARVKPTKVEGLEALAEELEEQLEAVRATIELLSRKR